MSSTNCPAPPATSPPACGLVEDITEDGPTALLPVPAPDTAAGRVCPILSKWLSDGHHRDDFERYSYELNEFGIHDLVPVQRAIDEISKKIYGTKFFNSMSFMKPPEIIGRLGKIEADINIGEFDFYDETKCLGFAKYQSGHKVRQPWLTQTTSNFDNGRWTICLIVRGIPSCLEGEGFPPGKFKDFVDAFELWVKGRPGHNIIANTVHIGRDMIHLPDALGAESDAKIKHIREMEWVPQDERRALQDEMCVLCDQPLDCPYGHNPQPLKESGRCCGDCNSRKVIPARGNEIADICMANPDLVAAALPDLIRIIKGLQEANVSHIAMEDRQKKTIAELKKKDISAFNSCAEAAVELGEMTAELAEVKAELAQVKSLSRQRVDDLTGNNQLAVRLQQKNVALKRDIHSRDKKIERMKAAQDLLKSMPKRAQRMWMVQMTPMLEHYGQKSNWSASRCAIMNNSKVPMWAKEDYLVVAMAKKKALIKQKQVKIKKKICQSNCLMCEKAFPTKSLTLVNGDLLCKRCE